MIQIKKILFKYILGKRLVMRILDNIYAYSDISFNRYVLRRIALKSPDSVFISFLEQFGVGSYGNNEKTGETFIITKVLPRIFSQKSNDLVFFDIGANEGNYSKELRQNFLDANIYCFEPNIISFQKLDGLAKMLKLYVFNIGLGDKYGQMILYSHKQGGNSEHSSMYKDVFKFIHNNEDLESSLCVIQTLDDFSCLNNIESIDFMKIDTEGFEYRVLKGALRMLGENRIKVIQFEFNKMNVISRVFFKDYYDLLKDFRFYRVMRGFLIPLGSYSEYRELFLYQNILAIHYTMESKILNFTKIPFDRNNFVS